jgi:muramoyltetrapeptide carboxypeptidase
MIERFLGVNPFHLLSQNRLKPEKKHLEEKQMAEHAFLLNSAGPNSGFSPLSQDTVFFSAAAKKKAQTQKAGKQQATKTANPFQQVNPDKPVNLLKPSALKPGDTIALVAPATPLSKKEIDAQARYLRKQGFKVVNYTSSKRYNSHYLSDTDEKRAAAINRAFANPKVKGVFCVQGGGGTYRPNFINALDFKTIAKNPKILTGFSDITFLHHALHKKTGLVTIHGSFPSNEKNRKADTQTFWAMLATQNPEVSPKPIEAGEHYTCLKAGEVTGAILGGNLSLLAATIGTPFEPDWNGKILFLEDWNDDFENTDRLMSQLAQRGVFHQIKGLILGEFVYVPKKEGEYGLKWSEFISDVTEIAQKEGIPIGYNFPIGHGNNNRPIPMGVQAHFNSTTGTLTFLESPVK